ncbi:MAG: rod shape-determining protein MreD [Mediterranea sp.]|jgi:rod shape-determining protein MreD|nr:rod shape-determining protein MreD [Mediterranea sp.]
MIISYIHKIFWFVGLLLLQVLILNNVHIAGYATPFLYIYFILRLEADISRNEAMLWGFALGLCIDIFSNTSGMNAAATVMLAFARPVYLSMFTPRDNQKIVPSLKNMGFLSYVKYLLAAVFTHHIMLFTIAFFSFSDIHVLLIRIVSSTVLTVICMFAIDEIRN